MARFELPDLFVSRHRRWYVKIRQVIVYRLIVDVTADRWMLKQRSKLGAKDQIAVWLVRIEQRFFADAVTSDEERPVGLVPYRESEHASKVIETTHSEFVI